MIPLFLAMASAGAPTGVTIMQQGPDARHDVTAAMALPEKIKAACGAWTGRIQYLHLDSSHAVIALVEIEGGGLDSVVFSYGQVIRTPVALDAEDEARLKNEFFTLKPSHLEAIPGAVRDVIQANPLDTTIDSVVLSGIGGEPRRIVNPVHPRKILPPVETLLPR